MRLLTVLVAVGLLFVAACGGADSGEEVSTPPPAAQLDPSSETPEPEAEPPAPEPEAEPPAPQDPAEPSQQPEPGEPGEPTPIEEPVLSEDDVELGLEEIASGLSSPLHVASTSSEPSRIYIVERPGTIRIVESGALLETPFLDIRDRVTSGGEQGLLSVAFHPEYEANRRFYVNYTDLSGNTAIVEFRANAEGTGSVDGSERLLLTVEQPFGNHNGGQLAFGPDNLLYIGTGDGGSGGDPDANAQNLNSLLGKLLRMNPDDPDAFPSIDAYGLRNPWRFSFDRDTGDIYIGDVGQNAAEEIDVLPNDRNNLANLGWDVFEGDLLFEDKEPNPEGELVSPIYTYGRDLGCSVTGGYVYRGEAIPAIDGRYFFGDFCTGSVWSLRLANGQATAVRTEPFRVPSLSSFGEDARGELYLVSLDGSVYRLSTQ